MAEAEYAGMGAFLTSFGSSLKGRREEQKRKHDQWMSCIMQGISAEDCTRILGYDPGEEARGGAEGVEMGRRAEAEAERTRKLKTIIGKEERGVERTKAKEVRAVTRGQEKLEEARTYGEGWFEKQQKIKAKYKTPKTPTKPTDWLKAPKKEETAIQKWVANWEKHIFTSLGKAGETGTFEDLSETEKQTHFNKWAKRIPANLRMKVREQVGMSTPTGKAPEQVSGLPSYIVEEIREFNTYDEWYDSLSGADRGVLEEEEIKAIKNWFIGR